LVQFASKARRFNQWLELFQQSPSFGAAKAGGKTNMMKQALLVIETVF